MLVGLTLGLWQHSHYRNYKEAYLSDDSPEKSPMIERLQRIASILMRLQPLIIILGLAFLALFAYSLLQFEGDRNSALLPAIAGFCWANLLFAFGRLFNQIPERPQAGHGFWRRWDLRFRRTLMTGMAILMLLLTLAVLLLSYQLLRTNFMS